ncbi:MAG: protein kinase [Propionibacteriaceae bacterium]|jgi:serine/threonine-protein kinase|nr:protein kinase [Propionibacteriaceae bacterium]
MATDLVGDRYVLGDLLGRGGMGDVWRARDTKLNRDVALKRLSGNLAGDPAYRERVQREAQAAAGLNHPNIVSIYDTGEFVDDTGLSLPYIVMELVDGQTLQHLVRAEGALVPARALEVIQAVLDALECSHEQGIIHRDIKPANVMVTGKGAVKVMDFGIARVDNADKLTQTGSVLGTVAYLAPEQIRGDALDHRADLYAAGCLLYELLTGKPPFEADSAVGVALQHLQNTAVLPSVRDPRVPEALNAICLKALAKNPDERYQTAAAMRGDIDRLRAGQPVTATEPTRVLTSPIPGLTPTAVMPEPAQGLPPTQAPPTVPPTKAPPIKAPINRVAPPAWVPPQPPYAYNIYAPVVAAVPTEEPKVARKRRVWPYITIIMVLVLALGGLGFAWQQGLLNTAGGEGSDPTGNPTTGVTSGPTPTESPDPTPTVDPTPTSPPTNQDTRIPLSDKVVEYSATVSSGKGTVTWGSQFQNTEDFTDTWSVTEYVPQDDWFLTLTVQGDVRNISNTTVTCEIVLDGKLVTQKTGTYIAICSYMLPF